MSNTITSLASTLTQSVDAVQKGIVETQNQLASGQATLNAAETGVVSRMTAQVSGYGSVTKNLTDAGSAVDVAQSALTSISTIMSQLKGLATQASSAGFASTDRDSLNLTFQNLTNQIQQLVTSASVNGANLLNTDFGLQVTTGIDGTPGSQTQINATNVGNLVTALKQLLITGMQITDQTFAASNLTAPVSTVVGSAIGTLAGAVTGTNIAPIVTFPTAGIKAGDSYSITIGLAVPVTLTLAATSDMTASQLASAFAAYITSGTSTTYGNFTGTSPGLATNPVVGVLNITAAAATAASTATYTNPASSQTQTITLPTTSMAQGNSLTIGNLTFTAGPGPGTSAAGISPSQVSAAFANYINNGVQPDPSIGTFTTTTSAVAQVQTITFRDLAIGDSFSAGGLTFTATATTTAAQLSTAFLAKIGNSASLSQYGTWSGSKVGGLGAAVSAGGSTTTIAWSYSATGGQLTNLLTTGNTASGLASYTIAGANPVTVNVPSTIITKGMNANTGTKITGGSAYGVSATVTSSNTFSLTTIDPLTTGSTPGGIALLSQNSNTTTRNALTFTNTNLLAGTANLFPGDSVTINGLTFTATQTTTPQQVLDAFKNVINSGDTGNLYGSFANTDVNGGSLTGKVSEFTNYFTAIDLGNNVLAIDNKPGNTSTTPPTIAWNTQNAAIANANKATQVITSQIDTVSTAQASLAAATAGIEAQLKNATNIKNGMQKTIDAIANIDPTALQAKLQEFNTQQSVDYYLVSQMNTEAAAILSIFR
ncbi:flagellin [Polynucleobacter sp. JS-Fieb-80-E5]|uniref:flagellin n=1 Tax=Polynucleobacter sp. JS-Fieb-80-E5 TaxID=2081050 RepID=UPI001C0DC413|nr:flagellin [Polynucleobacter sp. JS-Fieb-80-E5]MBU3619496.1 flagellin [Polynucleobacter sp. JS-Fieb-80-E5]